LLQQELPAAEEEDKTTAMMFTLLQEQHKAQLKLMVAAYKQAMDKMFKCMNVLIAGHSKVVDKITVPLANNKRLCLQQYKAKWKEMHELPKSHFSQARRLL
jgi:hypothetical protein